MSDPTHTLNQAAGLVIPHARTFDPQVAIKVCELIADGLTLRQIAKIDGMPATSTIMAWVNEVPAFAEHYGRAKDRQMDRMADELLAIADDGENDWMERELASGAIVSVPDYEHIKRSELRVNTRKWLMSKIAPKRYGEKLMLADADGGSLVERFRRMNAEQREEALMALAVKAGLVIEHRPVEGGSEPEPDSGENAE